RDVDITMVGGDVMYPAVMIDNQGDFWVAFSSSSTTQYPSSEVAEAPGGTIRPTIGGIIYRTGSGSSVTPPAPAALAVPTVAGVTCICLFPAEFSRPASGTRLP
ncbi:MAG: hypothetical protein ACLQFR_03530, partial [Streptosporangiaceae bacterium]